MIIVFYKWYITISFYWICSRQIYKLDIVSGRIYFLFKVIELIKGGDVNITLYRYRPEDLGHLSILFYVNVQKNILLKIEFI